MSPLRSSSTETCLEKWAILVLEAGAGGGVAVGLAGKLCRGLSSGVRSEGVVPFRYSSGLSCCRGVPVESTSMSSQDIWCFGLWYSSPWVGDKSAQSYKEPTAERSCALCVLGHSAKITGKTLKPGTFCPQSLLGRKQGPGKSWHEPAVCPVAFFTRVRQLGILQGGLCPPASSMEVILS